MTPVLAQHPTSRRSAMPFAPPLAAAGGQPLTLWSPGFSREGWSEGGCRSTR